MTWEQLVAFNIALLVAISSPGPALLMAMHTSASRGRAAGISVGVGLGLMAAAWTLMALLGLAIVFKMFPMVYIAAKFLGGSYLLYLAYNMWRNASAPTQAKIPPARRAFRQGLFVNFLNPKSALFAVAVLVAVFPAGLSVAESFMIVTNHFLVEVAFYTILAFCMSTEGVSKRYLRVKAYVDQVAAIILGALGVRLVLGRADAP